MSVMKKTLMSMLVFSALGYGQAALADCHRVESIPTVKLNMALGRVVISPDMHVGETIASHDFEMPGSKEFNYECTRSEDMVFEAKLVNPKAYLGNGTYATNIKGVGIRLSRVGKNVNIVYPDTYKTYGYGASLEGSVLRMELIKTADVTGSGPLASGLYSTYTAKTGGTPILETYINGDAVTVVSPSCKILSNKVISVNMADEDIRQFTGVGTKVGSSDFSIDLQCSGGVSTTGYADIATTFSGNTPEGYDKTSGVLVNEYEGGEAAKGVGFRVSTDGKPVAFGEKYLVGRLQDAKENHLSFPLSASYYQYDNKVSAGHVLSHMTYTITYQ